MRKTIKAMYKQFQVQVITVQRINKKYKNVYTVKNSMDKEENSRYDWFE